MFASDNFADASYRLDRAQEATRYCAYLDELSRLIRKLRSAIVRTKETVSLRRQISDFLQAWPICPYLDITEEHVALRVREFLQTLALMEQKGIPAVQVTAASDALSTLREEYVAVVGYQEATDD